MNLDLFIIILLSNNCFPNRMHARPLILPHAPNPRPHIQLGMFAIVIRIPLSPTRIRFIRIFHAFFQRPLFFRDAISFLHADQEGQRGFVAFCWHFALLENFDIFNALESNNTDEENALGDFTR
mmetsp:Transcript_6065/g.13256  ORF Transcript_6065/g.13256 Transcript_6065/m.13256 type:complete len:124 (+) Transcript_6065:258-629(+)